MAISTELKIDNVSKIIASGKSPIRATSALEWGCDCPLGVLSSNVTITLPSINYEEDGYNSDITITAYQPSGGSYTITIQTADASQTITDGDTNTTSVVYTPTASNNIEINIKPVVVNQVSAVSVEKEKVIPPIPGLLPVGGRIFYIHNDNGATYTFYDSNHNELPTQTVAGLANAAWYTKTGTSTADKFYVYDTTGLFTGTWGMLGIETGINGNAIGSGKVNTNTYLTNYASSIMGTMWTAIVNKRTNLVGGCSDWYIGSMAEQDCLRNSSLVNWFNSYNIWSSCESIGSYSDEDAYVWVADVINWRPGAKGSPYYAFAQRSF